MKNIFKEETPKITRELRNLIDAEMNKLYRAYKEAGQDEFAFPSSIFGLVLDILIPIDFIAISGIEMPGRMMVDNLSAHYDFAFQAPVVLGYWRSQGLLIHIDGWHRIYFASLHPELFPYGYKANIIDFEKIKGRALTEEEIIECCAEKFLTQKDGCAQLKDIDCFCAELHCGDFKKKRTAEIIKSVMDEGYVIRQKGMPKSVKALSYTLLKEVAASCGAVGALFCAKVVSAMSSTGNDSMRTIKLFVQGIMDDVDEKCLDAYADFLLTRVTEKTMNAVFPSTKHGSEFQRITAKKMIKEFKAFRKEWDANETETV